VALSYAAWPFRPLHARSAEETALWWEHCYLRGDAELILQGEPHWRILAGGPGSGKSAALVDLERREAVTSFVIRYPLARWPKARQAWVREGNHLAQIMAEAGMALRDYLTQNPEKMALLSESQRTFFRWLLQKFGGPRAFHRWIDSLDAPLVEAFQNITYEDIYPTTTDPLEVQGQIDDLASLVRKLGYRRALVTVDFDQIELHARSTGLTEAHTTLANLEDLFEWLSLMHHPGLALVAALPIEVMQEARLVERVRGRVSVVYLRWNATKVREIALRHLRQAIDQPDAHLEDFMPGALWDEIEKQLVAEYGDYVPAAWVALAETVLYLTSRLLDPLPLPLLPSQKSDIEHMLFTRHMPLRLDFARHGAWRGPKFIKLTDQLLNFLSILREREGHPINSEDEKLIAVAQTKGNIYSIASRTRDCIEPFPNDPIYVHNKRGEGGYWLENFM